MVKFYRTPNFSLEESSRVINNHSHSSLKRTIAIGCAPLMTTEKKESIVDFNSKYFYNEHYNEKERNNQIEKLKKECLSHINFTYALEKINDDNQGEIA